MFKGKKVLVTGSEGMIGKELKILLKERGALIREADIKKEFDLRDYEVCEHFCTDIDYVFHLAGIKGSPKKTTERPYDFMCPMLQFDTNMIRAAIESKVKRFLYTSSIAVENMETDFYPAWAKKTAENLIESARIQKFGTKFCIVRPANVYGRFDNINNPDSMVIASLIRKSLNDSFLEVWGDGSQVRDFINAKDVARGMIQAMEEMPKKPVNLCSGQGVKISTIAEFIAKQCGKKVKYDTTKPIGAKRRVMNLNWDFKPEINIIDGIKEVIWNQK